MGETTTLTKAASRTTSLRTTVPASIARQFNLKDGDRLDWTLQVEKESGTMIIVVTPLKQ